MDELRVDTETGDGGSSELSDTNSTASIAAVGDRHEVAQAADSVLTESERNGPTGRLRSEHIQVLSALAWSFRWNTRRVRQTLWTCPQRQSDIQVNAQLYFVLVMLVKDGAMKKARNAPVSHRSEMWRLLCEEFDHVKDEYSKQS